MGTEKASRVHAQQLLKNFDKSKHGLTQQILENKDKQNYESIEVLLKDDLLKSLEETEKKLKTKGTIRYLWLMRNIRDAFLDRSISPQTNFSYVADSIFHENLEGVAL